MRRDPIKTIRLAAFGLAALTSLLLGGPSAAFAQVPEARIPDINERSGLLQRFQVYNFKSKLPQDPYRDNFYGTRYGDYGKSLDTNTFYDGGLFGVRLPARDTASVYPFFYGSPGQSTITEESRPWRCRPLQALVRQRKPVGMYYDRGSYVPIYDLDAFTPGPGPDLWKFFFQGSRGG